MKRDKKNKFTEVLMFAIVLGFMLISGLSALAIGSPYTTDIPLKMYPGETKIVTLSLQNSDIERGVVLKGTIIEGSEFASLDKNSYEIPYKGETFAQLRINIPRTSVIGERYPLRYEFIQVADEANDGMIQMGRKIERGFDVIIEKSAGVPVLGKETEEVSTLKEKPAEVLVQKENAGIGLIGLIFILIIFSIVILLIYFFIRRNYLKRREMIFDNSQ